MKVAGQVIGACVAAAVLVGAVAFAAEDEPEPAHAPEPTKAPPVIATTPGAVPAPAEAPAVSTESDVVSCGDALGRCEDALVQATVEIEALRVAPPAAPPSEPPSAPPPATQGGVPPVVAATVERPVVVPSVAPQPLVTDDSAESDARVAGGREQVAAIVKGMKPREAAAMVAQWDEALAADILGRLSPRVAAPVLASMPAATAAKLTARIAARGGGAP